jgi:hypothetical protein
LFLFSPLSQGPVVSVWECKDKGKNSPFPNKIAKKIKYFFRRFVTCTVSAIQQKPPTGGKMQIIGDCVRHAKIFRTFAL